MKNGEKYNGGSWWYEYSESSSLQFVILKALAHLQQHIRRSGPGP